MLEGLPLQIVSALGLPGAIAFIFYMVATGRAATPRELREKNDEIKFLRARNEELNSQNLILIREQSTVIRYLNRESPSP